VEFFRNVGIVKRVVVTTFLVMLLPIGVFLFAHWAVPDINLKVLFFLGNMFLLVGLVSSWLVASSITGPLDRLRDRLQFFIAKRIPQTIPEDGKDEINDLAQDFNRIAALWNTELGSIMKKQKARSEEAVKVVAAQTALESQLLLTRSCLQTAQRLNTTFDFQTNLKTILDEAVKTLNVQWASILLLNRDTLELNVACVRGIEQSLMEDLAEDQYPSIKLKPNEGLAGIVIKEGTPLIANKGAKDQRFKAFSEFRARESKIASLLCAPIKGNDGNVLGVMNFVNRINPPLFRPEDLPYVEDLCLLASLVAERNRLYHTLFTDETTGMISHRVWRSYLQEEGSRAVRYSQPLCVTIIEIDHAKDLLQRTNGEFALKVSSEVGRQVRKCLRDTDVVSRARDRFYLLLPNTDAAGGVYLVGRIKEAAEKQRFELNNTPYTVTLSAGIAVYPETGTDVRTLVENAQTALEKARSSGHNRAVIFGRAPDGGSAAIIAKDAEHA